LSLLQLQNKSTNLTTLTHHCFHSENKDRKFKTFIHTFVNCKTKAQNEKIYSSIRQGEIAGKGLKSEGFQAEGFDGEGFRREISLRHRHVFL
jgi:hypothetical protein